MKLKYEANKGQRIKHSFMGYTTFDDKWWYNMNLKKWEDFKNSDCIYSTHAFCATVKAFRKALKKAPFGIEFILVSRYEGHNVMGIGSNKEFVK